jgi:hypothetical protein
MHIGPWDIVLVTAVSAHATVMAYLYHPKWKTLVYSLPIPFTIATMSVGKPVGIMNLGGLLLLLMYAHGVRILHQKAKVHIVLAILISAICYCVVAAVSVSVLPDTNLSFWIAAAAIWALAWALFLTLPHRYEPGYRTPLPVWIKAPIVASVVTCLVAMKNILQGFMTMFPMVGIVGAYETRHCMWAFTRQVPVIMLCMVPMMAVCRVAQPKVGLGPALLLGWLALLAFFVPATRYMWARALQNGEKPGVDCRR